MPDDNWQHRSATMRCRTCIFFVAKTRPPTLQEKMSQAVMPGDLIESSLGRCRRHAPTLSGWPAVYVHDWCGDHKLDENKI